MIGKDFSWSCAPFNFIYLLIFRGVYSFCSAKGSKQSPTPRKCWQMCTVNTHAQTMRVYTHTALAKKDTRCGKNTRRQQDSSRIHRFFAHTHKHTTTPAIIGYISQFHYKLHIVTRYKYGVWNNCIQYSLE